MVHQYNGLLHRYLMSFIKKWGICILSPFRSIGKLSFKQYLQLPSRLHLCHPCPFETKATLQSFIVFRSLTSLNVSHNKLHALPDDLWTLSCLKSLYLGHNRLTKIHAGIASLANLQASHADGCG